MSNKPIIAIADDNAVIREALAANLEARYELRLFNSGQAALDYIASQPVDLLLLDVEMPGLNGYQTCLALREGRAQPDIPVIFLSGRAMLDDRLQGYAAGGNDYMIKPCEPFELEAKIQLAIDTRRVTRRLAGEVAELSDAFSLTAEMMGEVGVVLEFQRALTDCATPDAIADAMFATLARFGLEGCVRLSKGSTSIARSTAGTASALQTSLLDHLASRNDRHIVTIGHNLGFSIGDVTLLVHSRAWAAAPDAPQTQDAMGRARDNVALLIEGAIARMRALDVEHDARQLVGAHTLIDMTRQALQDIEAVERTVHRELDAVFESIRHEFELRFPQLGLTAAQEDTLADILTRHRSHGLSVLAQSRAAEERMRQLVEQLQASTHAGSAPACLSRAAPPRPPRCRSSSSTSWPRTRVGRPPGPGR
jgi:CheY-like chemotaxis protein